ncbi:MAG: PLP-dependent transferase [Bacteroidota bacterium]
MKAKKRKSDVKSQHCAMETLLIHGKAFTTKWDYSHQLVPPISSSATFRLDSAKRGAQGFVEFAHAKESPTKAPIYIYDRLGEPNKGLLEESLAFAEGGETAVTFATGMAAVSAALGILTISGDEIIAHDALYGCTFSLMRNWYPRYNIGVRLLNMTNLKLLRKHITPNTRVLYFESPVNPNLDLIDIAAISRMVKEENARRRPHHQIYTVIDNTFATPFCQRPLEMGADFVVHSLTKNIGGFGTDMGGAVIGPEWSRDRLLLYRKDFGGVLAGKSAWPILVYGLPTLAVRLKHQERSAHEIATFLSLDERIETVRYPGLESHPQYELGRRQMIDYEGNFAPGSLIYFILKGRTPKERRQRGEKLINWIAKYAYTITLAVSLGNIRTLIEHPSSMTHSAIPAGEQEKAGIDPGGLRLSIGMECVDDIISDLKKGLMALRKK